MISLESAMPLQELKTVAADVTQIGRPALPLVVKYSKDFH